MAQPLGFCDCASWRPLLDHHLLGHPLPDPNQAPLPSFLWIRLSRDIRVEPCFKVCSEMFKVFLDFR